MLYSSKEKILLILYINFAYYIVKKKFCTIYSRKKREEEIYLYIGKSFVYIGIEVYRAFATAAYVKKLSIYRRMKRLQC